MPTRTVITDVNDNPIGITGSPFVVSDTSSFASSVSFTRTADTNSYAANDVVGPATGSTAAQSFTLIGPSAGNVMLTSASLEIDLAAVGTGMTSFQLALYSVTPPSAYGDNTAWQLLTGDRASFLDILSLGTPALPVTSGGTLYSRQDGINKQLKLTGTGLFGYLITNGAWTTPTSAAPFVIKLFTIGL